ncbi:MULTISPECIES: (d)CMP kinase [unclassified Agrobacterium]|uniref:(d)CMP kinase n=1 Tax=unclassified Agrobacterium TaxID=2632611 RepID=UPI0006999F85|nr:MULTISPECIES: (d)CMP kinase [unclassified Agrobacterium]KNY32644.1 cytidylate kinase [Agrobacterium sp. SUL3]MCD4663229.1 (d)CMP kinase [Agrobacterium sp.]
MTHTQAESFMTFTIAIDGPAAAGKGTLSRRIAEIYGFHHLDTGLTYRATAKALLDAGLPLDDEAVAEKVALELDLAGLDRSVLSRHNIGEAASKIAVMTRVRRALVKAQQRFAAREPGTVLDGRDIGTVVCPDAPVKLYVTASADVRARRRYDEILANGGEADYDAIFAEVRQRDERDMGRADSPLKPAEDAHLLDTSEMSIEAAFQAARAIIDAALRK